MDIFNTKKLAALEARIAALEPAKHPYWRYTPNIPTTTMAEANDITLNNLDKRLSLVEEETGVKYETASLFRIYFGGSSKPEKLTLRRKIERICEHLKIQFVTEPERIVIKPAKAKK